MLWGGVGRVEGGQALGWNPYSSSSETTAQSLVHSRDFAGCRGSWPGRAVARRLSRLAWRDPRRQLLVDEVSVEVPRD